MKAKLIALVVLLIPVMIFVYQNSAPVPVRFLQWSYTVSQALLLFSALVCGILLGSLTVVLRSWKKKKKEKKETGQPEMPESSTGTVDHSVAVEVPEAATADNPHATHHDPTYGTGEKS